MKEFLSRLSDEFRDYDYAHAYMESHAVSRLAAQIHALRKQRGWSQEELARRAGIAQERVSKIENADFDSVTLKTLQKFSRAFDVSVRVMFEPFSQGMLDAVNLDKDRLEVASRIDDLTHFASNSLCADRNGHWRTHPLRMITTPVPASTTEAVATTHEWQSIAPISVPQVPSLRRVA